MRIEHIAVWTKDLERLKDFYVNYFMGQSNGKYSNTQTGFESYFITFSYGCRLEIMSGNEVQSDLCVAVEKKVGLAHMALTVGSRQQVIDLTQRLRDEGYPILSEPRITGDGYFESVVGDPDGNRVEIVQSQIATAYDLAAKNYAESLKDELDGKNFDRMLLDWMAKQVRIGEKIIEIGCGPGEVSNYLTQQGAQCVGTDISQAMITEAQLLYPHITFEIQDYFQFKIDSNTYGGLVAFYAVVNYPLEALKPGFVEMYRILKQESYALFSFHVYEEHDHVEVNNFFQVAGSHLTFYYFQVEQFKAALEAAGFQIIDVIVRHPYIGGEYPSKRCYITVKK